MTKITKRKILGLYLMLLALGSIFTQFSKVELVYLLFLLYYLVKFMLVRKKKNYT